MVCIGNAPVALKEDLGNQISKHGNILFLTFRQAQEAEQVQVTEMVMEGDDLSPEELLICHSIEVLRKIHKLPDNIGLPAGLQSLTFSDTFNQSMEKVSLPAGLQSLTFGKDFYENME